MTTMPPSMTSPPWSDRTKRIVALAALVVVAFLLLRVADALPLIVIALVLAYLLTPVARFIDLRVLRGGRADRPSRRGLAILFTFILAFLFLVLVVALVLPVLFDQISDFVRRIPEFYNQLDTELQRMLSAPIGFGNQTFIPADSLREALGSPEGRLLPAPEEMNLGGIISAAAQSVTGPVFRVLGGAFSTVLNLILLLTMMFYLMKDGALFVDRTVEMVSPNYRGDARRLAYELAEVWDSYLRGQLLLSVIMGLVVFVVALLLGVPNATVLGLLAGVLEFIPTIGPALAMIPAALLALSSQSATLPFLSGAPFALVVIVVWTALQQIESIVLVPRIMGDSLNLHPFVVIIGVLAGASLAGALGVILAAPVIASLRLFGHYIYGKLTDQNPFPDIDPAELRRQRRASVGYRAGVFARWLRATSRSGEE